MHPAQSNMYAIPQPLRDACLKDFLESREQAKDANKPANYAEWLKAAFGQTFYQEFPRAYTNKYWTVDPAMLTTDWVGERVFLPNIEEVKAGYLKPLDKQTHYISKVRYPKNGGYFSYADRIKDGINVAFDKELSFISFKDKQILFSDYSKVDYQELIVTIPLPELILRSDAPESIKLAAKRLSCSSVLLVNITTNHPTALDYNWMYVYDEDKYSTRINCTELLSPNNAPQGKSGIQVEVYFSKYKPLDESIEGIADKVCKEMIEMGLIEDSASIINYHTKWVQWANVICDHERRGALDEILNFLSQYGLARNMQDLNPMTDWNSYTPSNEGTLHLAGRFAEWKAYWTDDCVLRGQNIKK